MSNHWYGLGWGGGGKRDTNGLGMEINEQKAMIAGVNTNAVLTLSETDLSLIG